MKVGDLVKPVSPAKIDGVSLRKGIVIQLNDKLSTVKIVWSTGKETEERDMYVVLIYVNKKM